MKTPFDLEIRHRVAAVLSGESTLRDFYRWFMLATWEIERVESPEARRVIRDITHLFSEFSSGDLTRDEMLRELELVASPHASASGHRNA